MKKIIILVIIIVIAAIYFQSNKKNLNLDFLRNSPTPTPTIIEEKLPEGWTKVSDNNVAEKYEKNVNSGLKPEIVLLLSSSNEASATPAAYVDRLKNGARSTLPSLRFTDDKRDTANGIYSAILSGFYYNQKLKIDLLQRVYIKGDQVFTQTASYSESDKIKEEINTILDKITEEKINNN